MKIVVATPIDGIFNVMKRLMCLGDVTYIPSPSKEYLTSSLVDADVLFINPNRQQFVIDEDVLGQSENLRWVVTASTGTSHIDMDLMRRRGIEVVSLTRELDVIARISSTAEHALCLTLMAARNAYRAVDSVLQSAGPTWNCEGFVGMQLKSKTAVIVGFGRLGKMYARYVDVLGMHPIVVDPHINADRCPYQVMPLDDAVRIADVMSLHVHLSNDTHHMINADLLRHARRGMMLINTSRGAIVDEQAVVDALRTGSIATYATDVIEDECNEHVDCSPIIEEAAVNDGNIIITPHIGGMTHDARRIAYNGVIDAFERRLQDEDRDHS